MNELSDCAANRPLLFAWVEGEVDAAERVRLERHLELCADCRLELERERALNRQLTGAEDGRRQKLRWTSARPMRVLRGWERIAALLVAGASVYALSLLFSPREAFGSIAASRLAPTLRFEDGTVEELGPHRHLQVAAGESHQIEVDGEGTLHVAGPAALDLDRTEDGWKLALMRGQVGVRWREGGFLHVTSAFGARVLNGGVHVVRLQPEWFAGDACAEETPAELLERGYGEFSQKEDMVAAEAAFRAAWQHADASTEERGKALFYLGAAVGRQDRYQEALELQNQWLEQNPDDSAVDLVLLFSGIYLRKLGREEDARAKFTTILERNRDPKLVENARAELDAPAMQAQPPEAPGEPLPARTLAPARETSSVHSLVLFGEHPEESERAAFREVAGQIAERHKTTLVEIDDADFGRLEAHLRAVLPESVTVVVPPQLLDVALQRRMLLASARLDSDVFPDCVFGWFTARDGAGLRALWKRTEETRRKGLSSRNWYSTFVTSGMESCEYFGWSHEPDQGFRRRWFAFSTDDSKALEFAARTLPVLDEAGLVTVTGNGDPQGIWLFDDQRNMDPARHWDFDPARVGEDPEGQMPRITAALIRKLKLDRPVVWSGTCHSAATHRVFVESDIVSTFGHCENVERYDLPADESLALAWLSAGAVALLAPIGANHGYSVDLEQEFALRHSASLGEAVKSTWDDAFLQANGSLALVMPEAGQPMTHSGEHVMQGGAANRAVLGDPTLRPFEANPPKHEKTTIKRTGKGEFEVIVEWGPGYHARSWNLYAADYEQRRRICDRVEIGDQIPKDVSASVQAEVRVEDLEGREIPGYVLTHAEPEEFHGRRFLHLEAATSEERERQLGLRARFKVRWTPVKNDR